MANPLTKVRNYIYTASLSFGLFYFLPIVIKLPKFLSRLILIAKSRIRFFIGTYTSYVNRPHLREIAIRNITDTLKINRGKGKKLVYELMKAEVFAEKAGYLLDVYTRSDIERNFTVHGLETVDNNLQKGNGIIFVTVHSGHSVQFGLLLALKGYNLYGIFDSNIRYKKGQTPLEKFAKLNVGRLTDKIGKLYAGKDMRALFHVLEKNALLVWMVDLPAHHSKRKSIVNFLGYKIAVDTTFWDIASKTGSTIIPHITIFDCKGEHSTVYIGRPIDQRKDSVQDLFNFFEPYIRKFPESWIGWYFFDLLKVDD